MTFKSTNMRPFDLFIYLFGKQFTNPQAGFTKKKLMNALNVAMLSSW